MTDVPVIEMVRPMPGFPERRRFALVQLDDDGVLCSMTSLDEPDLRFLVAPPGRFFPDYAPEVEDDVLSDLAIESSDDVLLLVVLNAAGGSLATTTANLAAPVWSIRPPDVAGRSSWTPPACPSRHPCSGESDALGRYR